MELQEITLGALHVMLVITTGMMSFVELLVLKVFMNQVLAYVHHVKALVLLVKEVRQDALLVI